MSHHSWSFCWSTPPPVNQSDCLKRDKKVHERVIDETCPEPLYPSTWQSLESQAFSNTSQIPPVSRGQPMGEKKLVNSKERREKTYRFMCVRERERESEHQLTFVLFSSISFLFGSGEGAGVLTEWGREYDVRVSGGKSIRDRNWALTRWRLAKIWNTTTIAQSQYTCIHINTLFWYTHFVHTLYIDTYYQGLIKPLGSIYSRRLNKPLVLHVK